MQLVSGASLEAAAVDEDTAAAQAAAAEKRLRALRADADAPTAVLALGDAVTRGVVTALTTDPPAEESPSPSPRPTASSTPEAPAPLVVGTGADAATVRALRDDVLDATIFADPRALVDATADAVQALLDGETPPRRARASRRASCAPTTSKNSSPRAGSRPTSSEGASFGFSRMRLGGCRAVRARGCALAWNP